MHVVVVPKNKTELNIEMVDENHFNGDETPNNPNIQFELENLSQTVNISELEEEKLNQIISFDNFPEGEMTFNFGGFEFEEQDMFKYRITQVIHKDLLEQENWNLDLVSFYIFFDVTQAEQGKLHVDYTIQKNEHNETLLVDRIRFINTYSSIN
jgi:hypothetical protein